MVSLNWWPHLCGEPLHVTGNTPESGKEQKVGEREDPTEAVLFKSEQKKLTGT